MPNINIPLLRADVLDRLDNTVIGQQLPEVLRQKLISTPRVTRALNQALILFVRDADPSTLQKFQSLVSLQADSGIGTSGVVNNVTTYQWPSEAFTARSDGGLLKVILNGEEKYYDQTTNTSLESVRSQASNSLYGATQPVVHVDLLSKRIYVPSAVTVEARVITEPHQLTDSDTYGSDAGAPSDIPISDSFAQTLSELATQELIKMTQNYANRQRVINDTASQASPQTEPQEN